jgi:hypothetical protein
MLEQQQFVVSAYILNDVYSSLLFYLHQQCNYLKKNLKMSWYITGVFQEAVSKGVRNISFGDLSGKLGVTMYVHLH